MIDTDREKLQQLLQSFDEAGLIALANKGLVRRATKDLQAGGLSFEETDEAVIVRGPDWTVTMPPSGPAHATDDTKASGTTRQILAATMFLRDEWAGVAEGNAVAAPVQQCGPDEVIEALKDLSFDALQKWAGKTALSEAFHLAQGKPEIEFEKHAGLTIRFKRHEIEARFFPVEKSRSSAKLLDQAIATAPKSQRKTWVAAAVLVWREGESAPLVSPTAAAPAEASGAPRTREQVLTAACELLENMIATGLAHPSSRMMQRLLTLSVSATGVHLPRPARLLRALADDVSLVLARDARADTSQLFERICFTHVLASALAAAGDNPPVHLIGRHRTEYAPVGDLRLAGVGAYPWRTASGYEGLTVLLWDRDGKQFFTWSTSRPIEGGGRFDLQQSYTAEATWNGGGGPDRLSRSQFLLKQARSNPSGRLSASQKTTVEGVEPTVPATVDFSGRSFNKWEELTRYALTTFPLGLTDKEPTDRIVVLNPTHWGERTFDELQQRFVWPIADADADSLELSLPWTATNERAIEFLESVNPMRDKLSSVVCQIQFGNLGIELQPLSLLSEGTPQGHRVLNPAFDRDLIKSRHTNLLERLRKKFGRDRITTTMTMPDDFEGSDEILGATQTMPGIDSRLRSLEGLLLELAESGTLRCNEVMRQRIKRSADETDRTGLAQLSKSIAAIYDNGPSAVNIMRSAYLTRLHRQCVVLRHCKPTPP